MVAGTPPFSDGLDYDELVERLREAEETLRAIRTGAVDAVVVSDPSGPHVYTLRGADQTYRTLVQEMGEGALCITGQGMILYANPAFCRLVRRSDSSVVGQPLYDFVAEEDRSAIQDLIRSAPARKETHILAADKRVPVYVNICGFDSDGVPVYCAVITDLTGQRIEQLLARDLEAMTRLQKLGAISVRVSLEPVLREIVDTAIAITGADFGNVQLLDPATGDLSIVAQIGFPAWWIDYWNSVSHGKGVCGTALERGERVIVDDVEHSPIFAGTPTLEFQLKAGVRAVQSTPLISRSGKTVGIFSTHYRARHAHEARELGLLDLLARQAADMIEHVQAQTELRESDARLRLALDGSAAGVWSLDGHSGRLDWDERFKEIHGLGPDASPSLETWLSCIHEEDRSGLLDRIQELRGDNGDNRLSLDLRVVQPGGTIAWVHCMGRAARETGVTAGLAGIVLDITSRKRIDEERARQARMKDEFLAVLGHELRNPLAAISTATRLLDTELPRERRASLEEMIQRQVDVLRRMVDDLLDIARISQGQIELKREAVDLTDLLQAAAATVQAAVASRAQEMTLQLPPLRTLFLADRVRLEQVVVNLLSNASKYTPSGGRIHLSGAIEGSEIVIRCKDNGRGIPLEMQEMIFHPFTRVRVSDESTESSVGLGLSLVKQLLALHGGTVSVESSGLETGSEFIVRLPFLEAPPGSPLEDGGASVIRAERSLSVVVVDDNPDVGQTVTMALEQAGHQVRLFRDGPAALAVVDGITPDAVLLDIAMPGMNGYEVATKLRAMENLRGTLLVGLSGFQRRKQDADGSDPFDHYFVKPVDLDALLKLLNRHASASRQTETLRVLLVEDNEALAKVTADLLVREGVEVRVAYTGQEALAVAHELSPQLVLCDLYLPDLPGIKVIQRLRSSLPSLSTHAVIVTAKSEAEIRTYKREGRGLGIDDFVPKPLNPELIRRLLCDARHSR